VEVLPDLPAVWEVSAYNETAIEVIGFALLYAPDGVPTYLWGVEIFDKPVAIPAAARNVSVYPKISLDPLANYGKSLVHS
jgi:hypothetical protein